MRKFIQLFHSSATVLLLLLLVTVLPCHAATMVDIYGPGPNQINLAMASCPS